MKATIVTATALTLLLTGCEPSESEKLYKAARQQEQQSPYTALPTYREIVTKDPTSSWADKAQQRIDAIMQRKASDAAARAADDAAYEVRRARRDAEFRELLRK